MSKNKKNGGEEKKAAPKATTGISEKKIRRTMKGCVPHVNPKTGAEYSLAQRKGFAKKFIEGRGKDIPWDQRTPEQKIQSVLANNVPASLRDSDKGRELAKDLVIQGKRGWKTAAEMAAEAARKAEKTDEREKAMADGKEDD